MGKYLVSIQKGYTKQGKPHIIHKTVDAPNRLDAIKKVGGFTAHVYQPIKSSARRKQYPKLERKR